MSQGLQPPLENADFAPRPPLQQVEVQLRPALSYWQDAWQRLRRNRRAMVSLWLLVALMVFSWGLPLLASLDRALGLNALSLDPVAQDLSQISQPPGLSQRTRLVDTTPWQGPLRDHEPGPLGERVRGLSLAAEPHTESVRLQWQPLAGAVGYRVYRHLLPPSGPKDLGLPLGTTQLPGQVWFEDRLKLQTSVYYYSVLGVGADGQHSGYATLKVTPAHAMGIYRAVSQGLIAPAEAASASGRELELRAHLLGTDYLGRDMLARLAWGGQTSLFIGIVAPLLFTALGVIYGGLSGYLGGRIDELMMRFADFVIALPFLLFMILFRVAMGIGPGDSGVAAMLIALVALSWPSVARLVRGQVLQLREQPFVEASRLLGGRSGYLVWRHMLPNVMGVVLVSLTFAIPSAIFTEAFLSFIGMGVAPPTPSWGSMCNEGMKSLLSHPHELLLPALLISLTVLAFNLLGDGLRDALDVKMRT